MAGLGRMHRRARILESVRENEKTVSLVLDASLGCQPGQFVMAWLPGMDEKPFSVSGDDPLMLTVARVGPFSAALHGLGPGDTLWVRGPFGRGFTTGPGPVLLVGGGYGAAPLSFLAQRLRAARGEIRIEAAVGARISAHLLFVERFRRLGVPVHVATDDGSAGARGPVTETAAALISSGGFARLCACGPEGMLTGLAASCRGAGLPAELSYEEYMRCGVGLCGSCEREGRLVCSDGPVFTD